MSASDFGFIVGSDPDLVRRIQQALDKIMDFGGSGGMNQKQWVLDQVVRILTAEPGEYEGNPRGYNKWLVLYRQGEDDPDTYDWSEGTPP